MDPHIGRDMGRAGIENRETVFTHRGRKEYIEKDAAREDEVTVLARTVSEPWHVEAVEENQETFTGELRIRGVDENLAVTRL
jgi:hypothetical protein